MDNIELLTRIYEIYNTPFIANLKNVIRKNPEIDFADALSVGQIKSKFWLIDELSKMKLSLGTIFVLGGWYGILSALMFEHNKLVFIKIRSFDINPYCADIADTMNSDRCVLNDWLFKASTADMYKLDYYDTVYTTRRANGTELELADVANTIINTSCEHLEHFDKWWSLIPNDKLCILQSNNYFDIEDHINCVSSIEEFLEQTHFTEVLYSGEFKLEKYNRFMIIGKK